MAELDNEVIDNDYEDTDTTDVDTDNDTPDEIDYNEAIEWRKKALRLDKAEKRLVELKKQLKEKPNNETSTLSEQDLDLRDELSEFLANNADLKEYKSELLKYRKDWFTMKQAKALVENDDKTIENRKKINLMNVTDWESTWKNTYSRDELAKLSQSDYNRVMDLKDKGQVKIKG